MKTLLLIRHAKSSWEDFSGDDAARPLNNRGRKNAPEMARRLLQKGIRIDAFISSPAVRARTTAELFADEYGADKHQIILVPALYMASEKDFLETITHAPGAAGTIAVFSHNMGITQFANTLCPVRIDHMPTCAIFALQADIDTWDQFSAGNNNFYFFDYPKQGQ